MFFKKKNKNEELLNFISGELIGIDKVNDQMFSERMLGDGYAVIPDDNKVYAPYSGVMNVVFPTSHAYGITTDDGKEILIHLGIDTVNLKVKAFTSNVKQDQKVKQGQLLGTFDIDLVKEEGYDITSMLVFTSGEKIELLKENTHVKANENDILTFIE